MVSFYSRSLFKQSQSNGFFDIQFIYNADDSSIMTGIPSIFQNYTNSTYEDCLGNSFEEPYDPRCRPWYTFAKENKGFHFYEPYIDPISEDIIMTTSTSIENKGQFISVFSIDFGINNIVKTFSASQTKTSYFVLLNEINNTIFYHPDLQVSSDLPTWQSVEFGSIEKDCMLKNLNEKIECEMEMNTFKEQVDSSIKFIKGGNYSIQNFQNTDGLYQLWTKNGTKKISLIYPVMQGMQGMKNQNSEKTEENKYSYSILLTARVNDDTTDTLKLFNIFNSNIIKIPLIIEICLLAFSVLIFIFNYGFFQMYQVQQPIELLIFFLKKSLYQQQSYNAYVLSQKEQKSINKALQYQNSKPRTRTISITKRNAGAIKSSFFKRNDDFNSNTILQYTQEQLPSPTRITNLNLRLNSINQEEKKSDENQKISLFSKKLINPFNQSEDIKNTIESELDSQTVRNSYNSQQKLQTMKFRQLLSPCQGPLLFKNIYPLSSELEKINQTQQAENPLVSIQAPTSEGQTAQEYAIQLTTEHHTLRYKKGSDYNCSIKDITVQSQQNGLISFNEENDLFEIDEEEQIDDNQETILDGLNPLFLEMQIIKETFQTLEQVINYQMDSNSQNSQDNMNSLLHFAKAKGIFQKMKNQQGHCRCFFNLGVVYLLKNEYTLASEYFEAAIQLNLQSFGIDSIFQINEGLIFNQSSDKEDQLPIFCKRLFSFAYSLKENAFQQIYKDILQTQEDESIVQKNVPQTFQQTEYKIQNLDCQIIPLLQKCFTILKTVQKLIQKNNSQFTKIYQTFVYQEILEVLLYIQEDSQLIPELIFTLENSMREQTRLRLTVIPSNLFRNQTEKDQQDSLTKNNLEDQSILSNSIVQSKKNSSVGFQGTITTKKTLITNILKSKFKFLKGIIEKQKGRNVEALDYLTQSLEEGTHYSPFQRKKTLMNIKEIMFEADISSNDIDNILLDMDNSPHFDIVILVQLSTQSQINLIDSYLENLRQQNIFKKNDRISIVTFSQQINILMPFSKIENDKHWKIILNILKQQNNDNISQYFQLNHKEKQSFSHINWKQAFCYSLNYFYSHSASNKLSKKEINISPTKQTKILQEFQKDIDIIYGAKETQKEVEFILQDESYKFEDKTDNDEEDDDGFMSLLSLGLKNNDDFFNDSDFFKDIEQKYGVKSINNDDGDIEKEKEKEKDKSQNMNVQERQRIILMYTKEKQNQNSAQNNKHLNIYYPEQLQQKQNKPQIFHMNEGFLLDLQEQEYNSQYFTYNSFTEEQQLIQKLTQIRNSNQQSQQSEYITVLNNF